MAWTQNGVTIGGNIKEFTGLSTEDHVTDDVGNGSSVWLLDTKIGMIYDAIHINPDTSDGWWEV